MSRNCNIYKGVHLRWATGHIWSLWNYIDMKGERRQH
jgi:hypothetical protein